VRDVGSERCGIVTFDVAGVDVAIVKQTLHERGVNVWTSRVCNNTRLEWETRKAGEGKDDLPQDIVRASVHYYNQEWEVERLLESVKEIARG
jgi:cysteine desulfurase/selenocysteine lyase